MPIRALLPSIRAHFDGLQDRLACFSERECELEGWFKGELLWLLAAEQRRGTIAGFDREVRGAGRQRIDLVIDFPDYPRVWVELKHNLIGRQRGDTWTLRNSIDFRILADVRKLSVAPCAGSGFVLLLLTCNPGIEDWTGSIAGFNARNHMHRIEPLTSPAEYPDTYFLGLLRVLAAAQVDAGAAGAGPTVPPVEAGTLRPEDREEPPVAPASPHAASQWADWVKWGG